MNIWVISAPHTRNLSATQSWEVGPYSSREASLGLRVECSCAINVIPSATRISINGGSKRSMSCSLLCTLAPRLVAIPQSTGGKRRRTMEQDTPERKYANHSRYTAIWNLLDYPALSSRRGLSSTRHSTPSIQTLVGPRRFIQPPAMHVLTHSYRQRARSDQVIAEPNVCRRPIHLQVVAPR